MAEFTATAQQTVEEYQNVLFTDVAVRGNSSILHREGSGLVTLRAIPCTQCRARFRITFGANIAIPTGGEVGPISLAIAINGESVNSAIMTVTPAAVENFFVVGRSINIDVPMGCCVQVSVENVTDSSVLVENANLIVERVA